MWLSTYRPVLVSCQARATEQRMAERKYGKAVPVGAADGGYSSADSAGDEESVESMLVDPETQLIEIIGNSTP